MTKAGDIPAWAQFVAGLVVVVFSAGAAWGGASFRLKEMDGDLDAMRVKVAAVEADSRATRLAVCSLVSIQAATAGPQGAAVFGPALEACKGAR